MKKVLIIFGSPRKNSNTHLLVYEAQKGIKEYGAESEIVFLNDLDIKGCQACYYCKRNTTTRCVINDDMQKIYPLIDDADGIIVASPIYFGIINAQTITWLDRMFPYIDMNVSSLLKKGKKMSLIVTQNQPEPGYFVEHINTIKRMLGYIGFEIKESLLVGNLDKGYKPMVTENIEDLHKAYTLGLNLLS